MGPDPGSIPMDDPIALFLTWTTYGAWLPGDERGWVEKPGRFREPDAKREEASRQRMTEPELRLNAEQQAIVEKTIVDHCRMRSWYLHAVNCRTQHVHVIVTAANRDPDDVMNQFKASCTTRLKLFDCASKSFAWASGFNKEGFQPGKTLEHQLPTNKSIACASEMKPEAQAMETNQRGDACSSDPNPASVREKWWTQGGSKRQLYDESALDAAIVYVTEGQEKPHSKTT